MSNFYGKYQHLRPYTEPAPRKFGPWVECTFKQAAKADSDGAKVALILHESGAWAIEGCEEDDFPGQYDCWVKYGQ